MNMMQREMENTFKDPHELSRDYIYNIWIEIILGVVKSRLDTTEKICELEHTAIESIQNDKHGGKEDQKIMNRESIMTERTVSSVLTYTYLCLRMVREAHKTVKAMAEKFPKLIKNINPWIKDHQQNPSKINMKKTKAHHKCIADKSWWRQRS